MENIYLTVQEKKLLKALCLNLPYSLSTNEECFAAMALAEKGFVEVLFVEGYEVEDIGLLPKGQIYFQNNPQLSNPINWAKVSAFISMGIAVLTLFSFLYDLFVN